MENTLYYNGGLYYKRLGGISTPIPPAVPGYLLLEDSGKILLEDGSGAILLEE